MKRRIYDAINVMSAVGLIVRNKSSEMYILNPSSANNLYLKPSFLLMRKEIASEGSSEIREKYSEEIREISKRILAKRKHYEEVKRKNEILKKII